MINFEKSVTAIIGNNISDKEIKKIGQNNDYAVWSRSNSAEKALAGAYVAYLSSQGVNLSQDQFDALSEKIESSLKRYKKKVKDI